MALLSTRLELQSNSVPGTRHSDGDRCQQDKMGSDMSVGRSPRTLIRGRSQETDQCARDDSTAAGAPDNTERQAEPAVYARMDNQTSVAYESTRWEAQGPTN